jgi:WD40 repeat protein
MTTSDASRPDFVRAIDAASSEAARDDAAREVRMDGKGSVGGVRLLDYVDPRSRRTRFAACVVLLCVGAGSAWAWWRTRDVAMELTSKGPGVPATTQVGKKAQAPAVARSDGGEATSALPKLETAASRQPVEVPGSCGAPTAVPTAANPVGGPANRSLIKPVLTDAYKLRDATYSPDGKLIATAGDDGLLRLWDASSLTLLKTMKGHEAEAYSVAFWRDGSQLASAGLDGTIRIWNTATGSLLHTFKAQLNGRAVRQYGVAYSPAAAPRFVDSVGDDGLVWIWDIPSKSLNRTRPSQRDPDNAATLRALSFSPSVPGEFVTGGYDGKIRFYRPSGKIDTTESNPYMGKVLRVAYSPDGSRVASAGVDHQNLRVWNARNPSAFEPYDGHNGYAVSVAWSADGKRLVSGGGWKDRTVRVWSAEGSPQPLAVLPGHEADVEAVAFHPSRRRAISVSEDKTMKVWDLESRRELATIVAFGEQQFAAYTPLGCYTGSADVERHLRIALESGGELAISSDTRSKLFVPGGLSLLLAGN